jgi:hypothetical protein
MCSGDQVKGRSVDLVATPRERAWQIYSGNNQFTIHGNHFNSLGVVHSLLSLNVNRLVISNWYLNVVSSLPETHSDQRPIRLPRHSVHAAIQEVSSTRSQ